MLSSFWQVASVIVLATFGSAVAFSDRLCDQNGRCLASSARGLLGGESVVKDYFRTRGERDAFDSRENDKRIRELNTRRFDTRTDRLSRVYEDRTLSVERDLSRERMRFNEVDNERSRYRSQRDRIERRMDQSDRRKVSNLRRNFRSTLKTVSGRNDDRQYRLSLERDSKRIASTDEMGRDNRERFILRENSQRIRDLVGSFNTRREMTRTLSGRTQIDDRKLIRDIVEKRERIQEHDVQNREKRERRELTDTSERRLRQERSENNFRRLESRSFNSNERFDINRNVLDASIPLKLNQNKNRRIQRDLREERNMNREETRVQDRESRRENSRTENTKRDGQTFNERRQARNIIESHEPTIAGKIDRLNERGEQRLQIRSERLEREIERKVHDRIARNDIRNAKLERTSERRIQDARIERETKRSVQDTTAERRQERENERRERYSSAERHSRRNTRVERENERKLQEVRADRRDDRNVRIEREDERRVRDTSVDRRKSDRNLRLERREQEPRSERREIRNIQFERESERQVHDKVDEKREARSMRLERETERREQETRIERRDSRNSRLERETERRVHDASGVRDERSERRTQEARAERRVAMNTRVERGNERNIRDFRNTRLERESTRLERENERREETRSERRDSKDTRLERGDERKEQETKLDRGDVRNARLLLQSERRVHDSRVERREFRNMRLGREDERKERVSSEQRRQDRRTEHLDINLDTEYRRQRSSNSRVDQVVRGSHRQFETRHKMQFLSDSPQVDSFKKTSNLNAQMLQALLIGMILFKVMSQQDMFTKKMNFMADGYKNVVSVGARKLF